MAGFKDIVGNEQIIEHLQNAISMGKVSHAYIINGPQLSGKMMIAEAFARALQCEKEGTDGCGECKSCHQADDHNHPDIIYVSHEKPNNISVDDIRTQLNNDIVIKPYSSKYKIYIVDEAEKMNQQAQNALLKTIEEPPAYAVIILLTPNADAFLPTILSRCVVLNLKVVSDDKIKKYLMEHCKVPDYQADVCVAFAQGNVGKAMALASSDDFQELKAAAVQLLKRIHEIELYEFKEAIKQINEYKMEINDYLDIMMIWFRDILLYKATQKVELYSDEEISKIKEISEKAEKERLINLVYEFSELGNEIKYSTQKNIIFQAGIIKLCNNISNTNSPELEQRINKIEKYLKTHNVSNNINQYQNVQQTAQTKVTYNNNLKYNDVNKKINTPKESKMKTSSYSNKIEEYWPQIVKDLKQNGKIVLYTNLMNTRAKEINDMTVGIEFPNGLTSFGRTVLEKQENIKELSNLISMASGKPMNIKYITPPLLKTIIFFSLLILYRDGKKSMIGAY